MRTTALIIGFGLLWVSLLGVSLPAAAETVSSGNAGASVRPEARIGSLAPDEARRAERARRRAAEKNARAAARDTKITEGKSVAVPGKAPTSGNGSPAAVAPVKAAVLPAQPSAGSAAVPRQAPPAVMGDAKRRDAEPRTVEPMRSADRDVRARDRRDRRFATRRKAHRERLAIDGGGDRRIPRQGVIVADDPQDALPSAPSPYPMMPRPRAAYMVRVAPPPPALWGYGPRRAFYPAPGYMHDEPVDDVD